MTKYKSEHAQAGGSVSVTYGSGGGANFNAAYNSAKLNTAQVENQTSVDVGKRGMDVVVKGNTHLEGAVISSQADKADNRFQTGTLTTKDIQNHSELKTRSAALSGGSNGINPMSALSLLGNKNKSSQSTTHSAIGESIDITLTEDSNAETTLKHLNRDTENANQKVTKHGLTEVKETQELVKGIGEIADKAMQIYTHSERDKIEEAKLALGKAKAANATKEKVNELSKQLNDLQKAYDKEYGTGSDMKRAVDAVTAALQGLATKDAGQAIAGLASPYLNVQIKRHTENADGSVNTEANLLAHAILGAVEATITGNNALAGAAAGAGGEAAAMFITHTLYPNKKPNELTEAEKKNITFLSQLAGGLASGLVGDSTQAVALGRDIAKRAVENNYLTSNEALKFEKELVECRKNNQDCSHVVQKYLDISNNRSQELRRKCSDGGVRCAGMEEIIDAHTNVARVKNDTTGRIYLNTPLQDDETIKIVSYLNNNDLSYLNNNISTMDRVIYYGTDPTNWPFLLIGARGLLTNNSKSAALSTSAAMAINAGGQYVLSGDVKMSDLIITGIIAKSTTNGGITQTVNANTLGGYYSSQINKNDNPDLSALYSGAASAVGYKVTDGIVNKLNPIINPIYKKYEWKDTGFLGISYQPRLSNVPQVSGAAGGASIYEVINNQLPKIELKGEHNENKK